MSSVRNLTVIIPWYRKPDHTGDHRAKVWDWLRPQWESTRHDLIIGNDPLVPAQSFSVARATNDACRRALPESDAFVMFGTDHVPDPMVLDYAVKQLEKHPWLRLYDRIAYASESDTHALCEGRIGLHEVRWDITPAPCPGVVAVRRDAFEVVGGMDGSYEGWGYEDSDFNLRLERRYGPPPPVSGAFLRELWHHGDHRIGFGTDNERKYYALYNTGE